MKHVLLFLFFLSLVSVVAAQSSGNETFAMFDSLERGEEVNVKIYPNPATSYIGLDKAQSIEHIVIYNMVGRRVKDFEVNRQDAQYYIGDLPNGMYLVQLLGNNQKIITTKRLNKR